MREYKYNSEFLYGPILSNAQNVAVLTFFSEYPLSDMENHILRRFHQIFFLHS